MFHKSTKKQLYIASIVSTFITFIFFLCFIYSSYILATDMLLHKAIDAREYAQKIDRYNYSECESPNAYIHAQLGLEDVYHEKTFSEEVRLLKLPEIEAEALITQNEKTKIETCQGIIVSRANALKNIDYKIKLIRHGLATLFFLILFVSFAFQSERIYRKKLS